jgi:hypothetical protein
MMAKSSPTVGLKLVLTVSPPAKLAVPVTANWP